MSLLEINQLSVSFATHGGKHTVVDGVDLSLASGESLAIVGESGSGKSVTSLAIMGLIDTPGQVTAERINFADIDLLVASESAKRNLRGSQLSMIFQDPASSLDPCFTVGDQLDEVLRTHTSLTSQERRSRAIDLLQAVGIPDPKSRLNAWPHQLSGGMSQRVMIAIAIACEPALLIADEPTTALDVTIQAQIMDLLADLSDRSGMAMILITHNLDIVADAVDRIMVMYAGQVVEMADKDSLFNGPMHPYTDALLRSIPGGKRMTGGRRLDVIPGRVPHPGESITGCRFHPRCEFANARCHNEMPPMTHKTRGAVRCFYPLEVGIT